MYDNHFMRIEEKYILTKKQKDNFLENINNNIEKDKYFFSNIHNIYFDNNDELIIKSLDKPVFKDKFRVRAYGLPKDGDYVFLEIKSKYKGIVGKRRIKILLSDYYKYLDGKLKLDSQIFKEIDYYFNYYNLKPSIYISYDRNSYIGKFDKNLRITFDTNIKSRRDNLKFIDSKMTDYFDDEVYIMEIKTVGSLPIWLVKILSDLKIYPSSFSKYGKIYEKEKMKERLKYA